MIRYKINDLQFPEGREFADRTLFKNKKEILDQLIDYHDVDFTGTDDEDNELTIKEYLKFHKIKGLKARLDWILDYGEWEIIKVKIKTRRLKDIIGINRHRRYEISIEGEKSIIISTNEDIIGDKYYIGETESYGMEWFKTFKEALNKAIEL